MIQDALVSASTGVMNSVIEKLAIFMGEEYKMQKNIQREVAFLKDELGSMNAVLKELANMEEELDLQTMVWRNQVMGMAFDIEDCIDDFMHQVGENSNIGDVGFIGRIAQYTNALRVRHNFGNQLQQLKTRVKDTSERRKRYKLDESASSSTSVAVDPRITALYTELGNLVGMDGPKEEVNKLLNEEGASGQHLRVVSIVGFGGLGKTTLANDIYSEIEVGVGAQYDCKAFVSVSHKPDIMKLLSMIISDVKMPEPTNAYQLKGLIDSIKKHLANKRYFFVIDDIWGASAWEVLRLAFPDNEGSKLITTTRIETVAAVCCNNLHQFIYKMKPLDDENSKKLIISRFGDFYPQSFLDISGEILQKCGGLPLAIISIASLLASQSNRSMEQWKYVCYSLSSNLRTNPSLEGIRQVLKLSYNNLPYHLKICLLYMGMYPEDYVIRKEKLVSQWLAEGFIGKIQDRDAEDVAGSYFNELVNRSMIQPMETGYYGEILCCKVHDMILDLIRLKSEEDNFMRVVESSQGMSTALQSKVRRLALHFEENQETEEIVASLSMSHIRSLTVFGKSSFKFPISELKFIRVLNLVVEDNGIDLTPIRQLFQLTYLDVGNAQLPTRIRDLQRLETLKCTSDIPSDIIDLPCLLHLHIRGGRLPDGICKMKSLRTLHSFDIGNNSADNLRGLGELKNIRDLTIICHNGGTLDGILKGHNQRGIFDVFWSSMSKLVNYNLRSLGLFVDFLSTKAIAGCSSFTCHTESNLEIFDCREWMFPRVPSWIGQHHKLSMLELQIMKLTQDGVDLLAGLPKSKYSRTQSAGYKTFQVIKIPAGRERKEEREGSGRFASRPATAQHTRKRSLHAAA